MRLLTEERVQMVEADLRPSFQRVSLFLKFASGKKAQVGDDCFAALNGIGFALEYMNDAKMNPAHFRGIIV